jgi:diguanylate cyclase (GGDEF)-like protein
MPTSLIRPKASLRYSHLTSAIAVFILVAQSLFFVWDYIGINASIERETVENGMLRHLRDVRDDMLDAETGQRGFLLTGNESYLAPYTSARSRMTNDLALLAAAPAADDVFFADFLKLQLLANRKLAELERTIVMRKRGNAAQALATVNAGYGKSTMDEARAVISHSYERITSARDASRVDTSYRIKRAAILLSVMGVTVAFLIVYGWRIMSRAAKENGKLADQLGRAAMHDALTGLPNRRYFEAQAELALRQAARNSSSFALMILDLDGFKKVNDTFGHWTGDEVLQETARRLRGTLRTGEFLARLGGDEFAAIVTSDGTRPGMARLAERFIGAMAPKIHPSLDDGAVGVSLGVAVSRNGGASLVDLLESADDALYASKRNGRGCVSFAPDTL